MSGDLAFQQCIDPDCGATFDVGKLHICCPACAGTGRASLLDIRYRWNRLPVPKSFGIFENRWMTKGAHGAGALDFSGVWRFRELLPFFASVEQIVTIGEGRTNLQDAQLLAAQIGLKPGKLLLQYEGLNPSGSFKDNGMTAAFTHARMVAAKHVACASTGNTSASLALFASLSEMAGIVFIGEGKIAYGKLAQTLDYGARTLQIQGDFDACLRRVRQIAVERRDLGIYLMNSVNPFRLEGQKAIMYRILEALDWQVPDWIVVPGGNLGNCSAFGKAFDELIQLGLVDRMPRLAVIQAAGANPLYTLFTERGIRWNGGRYDRDAISAYYRQMDGADIHAHTVASAIEIARPVNLAKALRALDLMDGVVRQVDDEAILEHKALVGRYGFGCEPASAASVAGAHQLVNEGVMAPDQRVVCILTGHSLKDPDATIAYHTGIEMKTAQHPLRRCHRRGSLSNLPIPVPDDLDVIIKAIAPGLTPGPTSESAAAQTDRSTGPSGRDPLRNLPVSEY